MYVDTARLTYLTICQIKVKFLVVLRTSFATIINYKVILHIHKKRLSFLCQYGWICNKVQNKVSLLAYRTHQPIHKVRIFHLPNELIVIDEKTHHMAAFMNPESYKYSNLMTKQMISKLFFLCVNSGFVKTCDKHVPSLAFLKNFLVFSNVKFRICK